LADILAGLGADPPLISAVGDAGSAAAALDLASVWRERLAGQIAKRARAVALATLSGHTEVEVAIVDRAGLFLARVGGGGER
jgi:hypothetical protein